MQRVTTAKMRTMTTTVPPRRSPQRKAKRNRPRRNPDMRGQTTVKSRLSSRRMTLCTGLEVRSSRVTFALLLFVLLASSWLAAARTLSLLTQAVAVWDRLLRFHWRRLWVHMRSFTDTCRNIPFVEMRVSFPLRMSHLFHYLLHSLCFVWDVCLRILN